MLFKIKKLFLLIFLILLQACSGGRVGNFLESSFDNLENTEEIKDENKNVLVEKKVLSKLQEKTNKRKKNQIKDENKNVLVEKKVLSKLQEKTNKRKKNQIKDENKNVLVEKKVLGLENITDVGKINNNISIRSTKKRKKDLQSYKIIFILKDVDPKDPIEDLSTILRNSEVNFEIEKIERFPESNNKFKDKN